MKLLLHSIRHCTSLKLSHRFSSPSSPLFSNLMSTTQSVNLVNNSTSQCQRGGTTKIYLSLHHSKMICIRSNPCISMSTWPIQQPSNNLNSNLQSLNLCFQKGSAVKSVNSWSSMRSIDVNVTRARWSTTIQVSATLDFWGRTSVTYVSFNCISAQFVMKKQNKNVKSVQPSHVVLMSADNISVLLAKQRILNSDLHVSSARRPTALRRVLTPCLNVSPKVTSCVTNTQIQKMR